MVLLTFVKTSALDSLFPLKRRCQDVRRGQEKHLVEIVPAKILLYESQQGLMEYGADIAIPAGVYVSYYAFEGMSQSSPPGEITSLNS